MKDELIARILEKQLPNEEAFYTEIWASGKVVNKVLLTYAFDGSAWALQFDKRIVDEKIFRINDHMNQIMDDDDRE